MLRAADAVRESPPLGCSQEDIDRAIDTLQAPYPERIMRIIRVALSPDDPAQRAANVIQVIGDLGLQPYVPPEPLPDITDDDVNLIRWQALVPREFPSEG